MYYVVIHPHRGSGMDNIESITSIIKIILSVIGIAIPIIGLIWGISIKLIERGEQAKNRVIDRQYRKNSTLEKEKAVLQKELDAGKRRHIQNLVDEIKKEVNKLDTKVNTISNICTKLDTQMESHTNSESRLLDEMASFTKETRLRFQQLEKDVAVTNAQYIKVGEDITMIKNLATKIRQRKG